MFRTLRAYTILDVFRLSRDVLITKLFYGRKVRKIRQPAYFLSKDLIFFGEKFTAGPNLRIEVLPQNRFKGKIVNQQCTPKVVFGKNVKLNNNVHIGCAYGITFGNNVLVGSNVLITDHNHGNYDDAKSILQHPDERDIHGKAIKIDDDVWLGENVCVLPGTILGKGTVVGAMSMVKGEFPPYSVIAGSPARILKIFNPQERAWEKQ
ncbi:acetyltransferase [Muricauda sp. CAU 1633]|uniref:acetyltransferase n=1 Tax=Allomuricauda sp. CAU 1633 TaxID=2816036 RepID=UPI001A8F455F|nr:acetyltransferase [Muricauda sp. CAU 1633]MBO0320976.1 acetyltransferase [Muricauda sp. CAU 1633]